MYLSKESCVDAFSLFLHSFLKHSSNVYYVKANAPCIEEGMEKIVISLAFES